MAPIKFEEELKEKLEQRSITISPDSWAKLSKRLDEEKESKRPRLFWWMGIAASLLLMLAIAMQFLNKSTVEEAMPQMVEEPIETETRRNKISQEKNKELPVKLVNEQTNEKQRDSRLPTTKSIQNRNSASQIEIRLAQTDELSQAEQSNKDHQKDVQKIQLEIVVAEHRSESATKKHNLASENRLDEEVDALLKIAREDLMNQRLNKNQLRTVDANALLESVQDDMGQSFRTKIFEALKDSYKTLRTKVAERNN